MLNTHSDLLRRHVPLHTSSSRLRRACDACRARKRACDRDGVKGTPCSLCSASNKVCTFRRPEESHPKEVAPAQTSDSLAAMCFLREAVRSRTKCLGDVDTPPASMAWFQSCCQAHLDHLHHRWPVVHTTQFNVETEPLGLSTTVIMLGCHLQGGNGAAKSVALLLHKALVAEFHDDNVGTYPTSTGMTSTDRDSSG